MECSKCGVYVDESKVYEAISDEEIIHLCKKCASMSDLPLIKREGLENLKTLMKKYDNPNNREAMYIRNDKDYKSTLSKSPEPTLRDVIDRKLGKDVLVVKEPHDGLIDNYQWGILRSRRLKKLTQEQFAEFAKVDLEVFQSIEAGRATKSDNSTLEKIEKSLGIILFKDKLHRAKLLKTSEKLANGEIGLDPSLGDDLTVGDLQEMNDLKIQDEVPYWKRLMNKLFGKKEKIEEKSSEEEKSEEVEEKSEENPSDEDLEKKKIEDIIYRRK